MNGKKVLIDAEAVALKQKRKFEDLFSEFGGVEVIKEMDPDTLDAVTANLYAFYQAYDRIYNTCGGLIDNYEQIMQQYKDHIKGQTTIDDFDENGEYKGKS